MAMFDEILKIVEGQEKNGPDRKGIKDRMFRHQNKDHPTPLTLAAARGTVPFSKHLLNQQEQIDWRYMQVKCRKMHFKGIDYPLDEERRAAPADHAASVLETLMMYERQDILSETEIRKLLQLKWDRYGRAEFHHQLCKSVLFAALVFVMPMLEAGDVPAHVAVRSAASLFYLAD